MPYYGRRKRTRKRTYRRRRAFRSRRIRKMARSRVPRTLALRPDYTTTLKTTEIVMLNNTLVEDRRTFTFRFDNCQDHALFVGLWDQYRINSVTCHFVPILTQTIVKQYDDTTTGNTVNIIPMCAFAIDRDDDATPVSYIDLTNRQGVVIKKATQSNVFKFRPTRLGMVYKSSSTTGYVVDTDLRKWIDCANADVPHFGLKVALQASSPSGAFQYRVWFTYNLSFRSRRH